MPDLDVLKQIYNACDPYEPATAQYYLDCGEARGGSALTREFQHGAAGLRSAPGVRGGAASNGGASGPRERLRHRRGVVAIRSCSRDASAIAIGGATGIGRATRPVFSPTGRLWNST